MNVQITWEGSDITNSVTEYVREADICTGYGTLDMTVEAETARDFIPWNTIIVYENGDKMGTYNIFSAEEQVPGGMYVVSCQDDSKRLTDYFIDTQYTITYPSTAKYWIMKFLDEAGVSYNFTVSGSGSELSENTTLGATSAYDAVLQLVQLCGWYFYFDEDNVCQIGKLNASSIPVRTFNANEILEIGYVKNDKMLRNRAVVWGAGDPDTYQWIYADTSVMTPWNRPGNDYRTIVYANGLIKSFAVAASLANKILLEFSQTIPEKGLKVVSSYSEVTLGSTVRGISDTLTVSGAVTHFTVNLSSEGFISTYVLDRRCPRLFGYANWNDWVYIGTMGAGVWRKWITQSTWYDYSTGIVDLNIKDVSAYDGLLGAIGAPSGAWGRYGQIYDNASLYTRHTSLGAWSKYNPGGFWNYGMPSGELVITGPVFMTSGIIAEACSIDRTYGVAGLVTAAFTIPNQVSGEWPLHPNSPHLFPASGNRSWIQGITADRVPIYTQQIIVTSGIAEPVTASGIIITPPPPYDIAVVDLETNWDGNNIISVYGGKEITKEYFITSGIPGNEYGCDAVGFPQYFDTWPWTPSINGLHADPTVTCYLPPPTSGIFIEVHELYNDLPPSGWVDYHVEEIGTGGHWGNVVISENPDTKTGTIAYYSLSDSIVIEELAYGASYDYEVNPPEFNEWFGYYKEYSFATPPFDESKITYFYKIDDTHYSATIFNEAEENIILKIFQINYTTDLVDIYYGTAEVIATYEYNLTNMRDGYWTNQLWDGYDYQPGNIYKIETGGKFHAILYSSGTGNQATFIVQVINMETGASTSTEIISDKQMDMIFMMSNSNTTPNYMYFGALDYSLTQPDNYEYSYNCIPVLINKNTGAVYSTAVNIKIVTENERYHAYGTQRGVSQNTSNQDYTYYWHRAAFCMGFDENATTGEGFGIITSFVTIWEEYPDPWTATIHHLVCGVVRINTPGMDTETTIYDDKFYDQYGSEYGYWMFYESPLWLHGYGYNSTTLSDGFIPLYSKNGSTHLMFVGKFRRSIYDETYYKDVLMNSSFDGITELEYNPLQGDWDVLQVTQMLDDEDANIYINVNGHLTGYTSNGNITKMFCDYVYDSWEDAWYFDTYDFHGSVVQNKILYTYEYNRNYNVSSIVCFYNPLATGVITTESSKYMILKHNPDILPSGEFTVIYQNEIPMYLDAAKNIPTVIYIKPYLDDYPSNFIGRTFLNEYMSVDVRSPGLNGMGVHDVRVFDLDNTAGMFPASGFTSSGFLDRYIGVAGGSRGMVMYNSELDPYEVPTVICSGTFIHLDITNNDPDPYMFVCTSGTAPGSGIFYQRDKESLFWNDYSTTLPSGVPITIIRADDRM